MTVPPELRCGLCHDAFTGAAPLRCAGCNTLLALEALRAKAKGP